MEYKNTKTSEKIENEYPKLVRDKIPEIIRKEGKAVSLRILKKDREYQKYLLRKIIEESDEFTRAKGRTHLTEEMADIFEILDALIDLNKLKISDIKKVQKQKSKKRGAFKNRILMLKK